MRIKPIVLTGLLTFLIMGCSSTDSVDQNNIQGPGGPRPGGSVTEYIHREAGGSVTYGALTIDIPPGSLNQSADVTVRIPSSMPGYVEPVDDLQQIGYIYEVTSSCNIFHYGFIINFTYSDENVIGYNESTVTIWALQQGSYTPGSLYDTQIFPDNNLVKATTDQLSFFFITISTAGY